MRLIKPSFEIWDQQGGLEGIYKQIERAGRVCYKSEDKITENSAKSFVDRMVKSGHGAMLEHGTAYLHIPDDDINWNFYYSRYRRNPYSKCNCFETLHGKPLMNLCITTNYRTIIENNWLDDLKYLCEPTEYHAKRATVHFVCDRGVSHEYVRHRVMSFAQESQRYCNYSKEKFGNEVSFIIPCWADGLALQEVKGTVINSDDFGNLIGEYYYHLNGKEAPYFKTREVTPERNFIVSLQIAEQLYLELLNQGWKPQQARLVLPNACKTELVMTGFVDDWWGEYLVIDKSTGLIDQRIHGKFYDELNNIDRDKYRIVEKGFFPLRCSSGAHPQAQELAIPLRQEFINKKIW